MKKLAALVLMLILALITSACAGDEGSSSGGNEEHNSADVTFATAMIPHHQQAVEMAELAAQNAEDPQVKELAGQIEAAQQPEIDELTGWLKDWDEPVPDDTGAGMGGHDMSGMMSDEDMLMLEESSGAGFDEMWLEMMIEHHEGAVEMAQTEVDEGKFPAAIEMAEQIIASQQDEIDQRKDLLAA